MSENTASPATDTIYDSANRLMGSMEKQLREGQEIKIGRGITLAHFPVKDTALAACLATLEIPFRTPAPYTDDVALDESGNECGRTTLWWLGDASPQHGEEKVHRTEELLGAWIERERFLREHPLHPLNAMRAAIDARTFWLSVIDGWRIRRPILPTDPNHAAGDGAVFATDSINAASVLKACGFAPVAFTGRAFHLQASKDGVHAGQVLAEAAKPEGQTPPQWMDRFLRNFTHMLKIAKSQAVIIRQPVEDQTLLLTADATPKTREKFHRLL